MSKVHVVLEVSLGGGVTVDTPLKGVFKSKKLARLCARTWVGPEVKAYLDPDKVLCFQSMPDLIVQVRTVMVTD